MRVFSAAILVEKVQQMLAFGPTTVGEGRGTDSEYAAGQAMGRGTRDRSLALVGDGGIGSGSLFDQIRWEDVVGSLQTLGSLFRKQVRTATPIVSEVGQRQVMLVLEATDSLL
jgi:hypothetical protein